MFPEMLLFEGSIYYAATLPCYPFFKATAKAQNSQRGLRPCQTTGSIIFLSREEAAWGQAVCRAQTEVPGSVDSQGLLTGLSHRARTEME